MMDPPSFRKEASRNKMTFIEFLEMCDMMLKKLNTYET